MPNRAIMPRTSTNRCVYYRTVLVIRITPLFLHCDRTIPHTDNGRLTLRYLEPIVATAVIFSLFARMLRWAATATT